MEGINYEDALMLSWFWETKGDITRYAKFDEVKPILEAHHPEVLEAWKAYEACKKQLTTALTELEENAKVD